MSSASTSILSSLQKIAPKATVDLKAFAEAISTHAPKYGITTEKRMEAFLAQLAHETNGFRSFVEYATGAAYEGRADLGNTQPGDGRKFKGRGGIMTTGRTNYRAVSRHLFGDDRLLDKPEILEQPYYAALSSMFYWKSRGLNELADKDQYKEITKRINGGLNGWADRLSFLERAKMAVDNSSLTGLGKEIQYAVVQNPEISIATGLTIFSIVTFYIIKAAKLKK
jgi:putative chitinase